MKVAKAPQGIEAFNVVGIGLSDLARQRIQLAYPGAIFQLDDPEGPEQVRKLCDVLGRVVIFLDLPGMADRVWIRASAIFNSDLVKVIGVHPNGTDAIYDRALQAELAGVLSDDADDATYRRAALSVQRGELWFPRAYLSLRTRAAAFSHSASELSEREAEILPLLAAGCTNQSIADRLFISRDTVRWHLRSIYSKLGVSDREAALRVAKNQFSLHGASSPMHAGSR